MERDEAIEGFETERQCREYLAKLRWPDGYRCPRCKADKAWKTSELKYKCQSCGYKASVTAGTVFQDSHVPLPLWFEAIAYVLSRSGHVSANDLQKRIGVGSNRTARSMLRKIKANMLQQTPERLQGVVEVRSASLRFQNRSAFLAIAVERNNQKTGRIRIEEIKHEPASFYAFVERCIEPHSAIMHREPLLRNEFLLAHYARKNTLGTYKFTASEAVFNRLRASLGAGNLSETDLAARLEAFCKQFNGLKTTIGFHEFMQTAVKAHEEPRERQSKQEK